MRTPVALLKFEDFYAEATEMIDALNIKVKENLDKKELYAISSAVLSIINQVFIEKGKERFLPFISSNDCQIVVSFVDSHSVEETKNIVVNFLEILQEIPKTFAELKKLSMDERIKFNKHCKENNITSSQLASFYNVPVSYIYVMRRSFKSTGKLLYNAPYKNWDATSKARNFIYQIQQHNLPLTQKHIAKVLGVNTCSINRACSKPNGVHHDTIATPVLLKKYCALLKQVINRSICFYKKEPYSRNKFTWVELSSKEHADGFCVRNPYACKLIANKRTIGRGSIKLNFRPIYDIKEYNDCIKRLDEVLNNTLTKKENRENEGIIVKTDL